MCSCVYIPNNIFYTIIRYSINHLTLGISFHRNREKFVQVVQQNDYILKKNNILLCNLKCHPDAACTNK